MTRGVGGHSPANVLKHIEGVHFPASKRDLVEAARQNGAPSEVMDELNRLPQDRFGGPQEILQAYGQEH